MTAVLRVEEPSARYLVEAEPAFVRRFEQLAGAPGGCARLRDLVLRWALKGRLIPQLPGDVAAASLLATSRAATARTMAAGQGKREKAAQPVTADEQSFALPTGWVWCRVTDTGEYINGLAFKPSDWGTIGRPIIRIQNLSGRSSHFNRTTKPVDPSVIVHDGDILVSWSATLDLISNQPQHRLTW